jgi:hypothetical protein
VAEILMMLVSFFITGPFQSDLSARLAAARLPVAVVNSAMAQVQECAAVAVPALARRAVDDPWWGITTLAGIAFGLTEPRPVMAAAVPACAAAIATVEPLLNSSAT